MKISDQDAVLRREIPSQAGLSRASLGQAVLSPETLGPERLSPGSLSQGGLSPERLSPERLSPERLSPERLSPERLSPERLSQGGLRPERLSPERLSQGGLSPERLSQESLGQLAGSLAARPECWSHLVRFSGEQRWYHRLQLTDKHEVWLLSWLPGQHTGFHDHGDAVGAFAVAFGRLTERTVARGQGHAASRLVPAVTVRSFGSHYVHDVINESVELAVSVHAYSPPLTAMRRYELTQAGLVEVATKEAGQDW